MSFSTDAWARNAALYEKTRTMPFNQELASGQLSAAVLDVLQQEPAGPDHPFWHHPQILLTPHIAAMTQPESAFGVLLENIRRHQRGEAMLGQIDRKQGY